MSRHTKPKTITVTGIVVPNDWDRGGRLSEVVLCAADESEFVLAGDKQRELFALCHHRLSVTGTEASDDRGRRALVVAGYAVLGNEADCGYESGFQI